MATLFSKNMVTQRLLLLATSMVDIMMDGKQVCDMNFKVEFIRLIEAPCCSLAP